MQVLRRFYCFSILAVISAAECVVIVPEVLKKDSGAWCTLQGKTRQLDHILT